MCCMKKSNPTTSTSKRHPRSGAEKLLAYYDRRRRAYDAALKAARSYFAVEGIHDLRVEVKRLRALLKLIAYLAPSFALKPKAAGLKDIFRTAGRLRDIDIHQTLVLPFLKQHDLREYFNHLKSEELEQRPAFLKVSAKEGGREAAAIRSGIAAALSTADAARLHHQMRKRIGRMVTKLERLVSKRHETNEELHAVRKRAKALKYTLDIWQECFGKSRAAEAASVRLKSAYNSLGEWHDSLVTLDSTKRFARLHAGRGLADAHAYELFEADLKSRARRLLGTYEQGKRPLRRALALLFRELETRKARSKTTARHQQAA